MLQVENKGKMVLSVIKICGTDGCEAIWHNCPKNETHCKDCGGSLIMINEDTMKKKFSNNWFQYDWQTYEYYRPFPQRYIDTEELQLSLNI